MPRDILAFISMMLLVKGAMAAESCEDVEKRMMTCVTKANQAIMNQTAHSDMVSVCRSTSELLNCVDIARSACPNMSLFSNPDFTRAIAAMQMLRNRHCDNPAPPSQRRAASIQGDQEEACDPLEAMMRCNEILLDVPPGDIKALCLPGYENLACLRQVVESCPDHADVLPFDLQQAINISRVFLDRECPAVLEANACAEKIDKAKQSCAALVEDPFLDECGAMKTYKECLDITLMSCPDPELKMYLTNLYQQNCAQGGSKCPDDLQSAMMSCVSDMGEANPVDMDSYCRTVKEALACVQNITGRCEDDPRLAMVPSEMADRMSQQINDLCPGGGVQPLPDAGSACPSDVHGALEDCASHVHRADPSDRVALCRHARYFVSCVDNVAERCENEPRFLALLSPEDLQQLHRRLSHLCPNDGKRHTRARPQAPYHLHRLRQVLFR